MGQKFFVYKNNYNYEEYRHMCDRFCHVRFPLASRYATNHLLASYIFSVSTNRISYGKKAVLRRLLAFPLVYSFDIQMTDKTKRLFVFTGDGAARPDYLKGLNKVVSQAADTGVCIIDRNRIRFSFGNLLKSPTILVAAIRFHRVTHDFLLSVDMAANVFRSIGQADVLHKYITRGQVSHVISFCDQWPIDSAIMQWAKQKGYRTTTLQHGNGTEILYNVVADDYLCDSKTSLNNALVCGVPKEKLILCGPMKYAGEQFDYPKSQTIKSIGVILDGGDNDSSNCRLLDIAQNIAETNGLICYVRFHPSQDIQTYQERLRAVSCIADDMEKFESHTDVFVVCKSTYYTDLIYKKKLVYRFRPEDGEFFTQLGGMEFEDESELQAIIDGLQEQYDVYLNEQQSRYEAAFGQDLNNAYKTYFEKI